MPLTPKVFDTLLMLVENSGRVISKQELMEKLWPDSFVEEGSLTRSISTLRKVLGDSRHDHRFIVTIPGQGYCFVADVKQALEDSRASTYADTETDKPNTLDRAEPLETSEQHSSSAAAVPTEETEPLAIEEAVASKPVTQRLSEGLANRKLRSATAIVLFVATALTLAFAFYRFWHQSLPEPKSGQLFHKITMTKLGYAGKVGHATVSPDGRFVVYVRIDGGQQSLWVRHLATESHVQIMPPRSVLYSQPAFSRDSNYIYYAAFENGSSKSVLYQLPVLGGSPRKLAEDVDSAISVSPDGNHFVFVRNNPDTGELSLIVMNAEGDREWKLYTSKRPEERRTPSWSPDAKAIACSVKKIDGNATYWTVAEIRLEDGREKFITSSRWAEIGALAWVHNGSGLIMTASVKSSPMQIWELSRSDGHARALTNDLNTYHGLSLTADSKTLTTVKRQLRSDIWIVDSSDRAQQITSGTGISGNMGLSWTADDKIVYTSNASGQHDIWMMNSDGTGRKQLTFDSGFNFQPEVSPDGKSIVFVSTRKGSPNIWTMDLNGGNASRLTYGARDISPMWAADGKSIFYRSYIRGRSTLLKIPIAGGGPIAITEKYAGDPIVSPDGRWLSFPYVDQQVTWRWRLGVIALNQPVKLKTLDHIEADVAAGRAGAPIRWTDRHAFTYVITEGGISNIWVNTLDRGSAKRITNFNSDQIFYFDCSPDGKKIACARGDTTGEVVLIKSSM